ncbi:hypothetical protein NPIL_534441 [Nephila pilipes]|uniref:Uncharacterized protein n=1 Tax=Nephila pilipes TaxID=299642 RepID=A0A8X6QJD4_NEPPI|nr:hypothetical protein NPIL_534441 [Nephila pilipes]
MVSPVSHGASPLSPSGASEKRSSSSACEALMDPRALSFSVCFLLLPAEDPVLLCFVSSRLLMMNFLVLTGTCLYFLCAVDFLNQQNSTWDLVVPKIIYLFCNHSLFFGYLSFVPHICKLFAEIKNFEICIEHLFK